MTIILEKLRMTSDFVLDGEINTEVDIQEEYCGSNVSKGQETILLQV